GAQRYRAIQYVGDLRASDRTAEALFQQCARIYQCIDRRLAVQWHCYVAERFSFHAADRFESIWRWRYAKSRPAICKSGLLRAGRTGESGAMVRSERIPVAYRR